MKSRTFLQWPMILMATLTAWIFTIQWEANATDLYGSWPKQSKLYPVNVEAEDQFGGAVGIWGDTAIVGARFSDNGETTNAGVAYIYTRKHSWWIQYAKLIAPDPVENDEFGWSVAIWDDTAIVGARYDDDGGINAGSAYVFVREGTSWTLQAKLIASDAGAYDSFGYAVALWGDTAIISAPRDDGDTNDVGAAYVFTRNGTTWTQQEKLAILDEPEVGSFGMTLALWDDTAVIKSSGGNLGERVGSVYVFTRSGTTWSKQAQLTAPNVETDDGFGRSVSIWEDTVIVGAAGDDDGAEDSGSAYVFTRSDSAWSLQAKLTASDAVAKAYFGMSISVWGDTAVVGASGDNNHSGAAYVFTRKGTQWTQQPKLASKELREGDTFGWSTGICNDMVVVGAPSRDIPLSNIGGAYVFDAHLACEPAAWLSYQ